MCDSVMRENVMRLVITESRPIGDSGKSGVAYRRVLVLAENPEQQTAVRGVVNELYATEKLTSFFIPITTRLQKTR